MKTPFEEIASNRLEEKEMPCPIRDLVHVPLSINIPEILEYLECADFEHWLTAAFFENAHRIPLRYLRSHGVTENDSVEQLWQPNIKLT
jgi:hypothetical protein